MNLAYGLRNICFDYGNERVLSIHECDIASNRITAFVGPNGAGKTTLLNLLAFLSVPSSGQMFYQGRLITPRNSKVMRTHIGYVQQKPYLLKLSVRENIELGLKLRHVPVHVRNRKSRNIMEKLGIDHLSNRNAQALSGGEVQKVAIARTLVLKPEVLIFDEPFTHLDKAAVLFFESFLQEIRSSESHTIVLTTHDQIAAQLMADRVYSLVKGHILPGSLTNVFHGRFKRDQHLFDTGRLQIHIPDKIEEGEHLTIDPASLVLSRERLSSSMRNCFQGRVVELKKNHAQVLVVVEVGETFRATITQEALDELGIRLNDPIWLSFKSSSVAVF